MQIEGNPIAKDAEQHAQLKQEARRTLPHLRHLDVDLDSDDDDDDTDGSEDDEANGAAITEAAGIASEPSAGGAADAPVHANGSSAREAAAGPGPSPDSSNPAPHAASVPNALSLDSVLNVLDAMERATLSRSDHLTSKYLAARTERRQQTSVRASMNDGLTPREGSGSRPSSSNMAGRMGLLALARLAALVLFDSNFIILHLRLMPQHYSLNMGGGGGTPLVGRPALSNWLSRRGRSATRLMQ